MSVVEDSAFEKDKARMLHTGPLRSAQTSLLWVAVLSAVGQLFSFAQSGGADVANLAVGLAIAGLFAALWRWSKSRPLAATGTALGIFLALRMMELAVSHTTVLKGFIFKIVILVILIRGVRAGLVLRRHGITTV